MKKFLSLILALCMVLCMTAFAAAEEVPTIKIITLGNGQPENYDAWIAHLNPYIEEKIGCKLSASAGAIGAPAATSSSPPVKPMTSSSATAATCARTLKSALTWTSPISWLNTPPAWWS